MIGIGMTNATSTSSYLPSKSLTDRIKYSSILCIIIFVIICYYEGRLRVFRDPELIIKMNLLIKINMFFKKNLTFIFVNKQILITQKLKM
jgi:hypothetical protein